MNEKQYGKDGKNNDSRENGAPGKEQFCNPGDV